MEGIDHTFLQELPEEYRNELLQNEDLFRRNLGQPPAPSNAPVAEAQPMDTASFIATITDPALRLEVLSNLDHATLASLPPSILAEARRAQNQIRYNR